MYRPSEPFTVPFTLLAPETVTAKGSTKKIYKPVGLIYCSYRTFGGTEITVNGNLVVENTAVLETWYRPDIKASCKLQDTEGNEYEIIGTPENISMRNQFLKFKIRALAGGA